MPRIPLSLSELQLKRVLNLVWKAGPGWTLTNGALLRLQAVLPLLQLCLMKLTLDALAAGVPAPDKPSAIDRLLIRKGRRSI